MSNWAHRAVVGACVALACGCTAEPPPAAETQAPPLSKFEGVQLVEQDPDGTRWHLSAREGGGQEREGTGDLRGVEAWFERSGRRVRLAAGSAVVTGADRIALADHVEVRWSDYVARTSAATYRRGRGEIEAAETVELVGPGMTVRGRGLVVDVEGRRARVGGRVKALFEGGAR